MAVMGYTSGVEDWYTPFADMQLGSPAIPVTDGLATSITAYVWTDGATNMKCALYNNTTSDYIATTEEKSVNTGTRAWTTFNFITPVNIYSNITYLIACWSDVAGGTYTRCSYTAIQQGAFKTIRQDEHDYTDGSWSNPWVNSTTNDTIYYMIYCTYTPISSEVDTNLTKRVSTKFIANKNADQNGKGKGCKRGIQYNGENGKGRIYIRTIGGW